MPTLTEQQKVFIVTELACFDSPSEVCESFKEQFGIEIKRDQVWTYDASHPVPRGRLSQKFIDLFDATRKKFLEETSAIPIANKAVRLRELQKLLDKAKDREAITLAMNVIEQAAKEEGGVFTNRQKVEHSGEIRTPDALTDDERAARLASILDAARARRDGSDSDGADEA